jgi:ribosomal protein L37E
MIPYCNRCGGQTVPRYEEVQCLQCGHDQQPRILVTSKEDLDKKLEIKSQRPMFGGRLI